MKLFVKFLEGKVKNKKKDSTQRVPDEQSVKLANQYLNAWESEEYDKLDTLAEEMIEAAGLYWMKCDFRSFSHLLHTAETISYTYSGVKYPRILVEELIKKQREG